MNVAESALDVKLLITWKLYFLISVEFNNGVINVIISNNWYDERSMNNFWFFKTQFFGLLIIQG